MAKETALDLFQGTDHLFIFTVLNEAETAAVNISGWGLSWMVKKHKSDADNAALLTKLTPTDVTISGTYDADPVNNSQIATVTVVDTDSTSLYQGLYAHELKRTDDGFETVLSYGQFSLIAAVHR